MRDPTAAELAELEGTPAPHPRGPREPTPAELTELNAPAAERPEWLTPGARAPEPKRDYPEANVQQLVNEIHANKNKPQPTQPMAAVRGAAQGASAGFADEAAGVWRALFGTDEAGLGERYRAGRDAYRAQDAAARKAYPGTFTAGELGGGLLTLPVGGAAATGAKAVVKAAGVGAAYGLGNSEADVTRGDVAGALKDTAIGAGVGAAGSAIVEGGKAIARNVVGGLKRRVLNEVAEGTTTTTPTGRKKLEKAGEAIVQEVVHGPDAKEVRSALATGNAMKAKTRLERVTDRVGDKLDKAYTEFEQAGRADVDMRDYLTRLGGAYQAAVKAGKMQLANGIKAFAADVGMAHQETQRIGGTFNLRQLRNLTTETQGAAASVLGGLHESAPAVKLARQISGVASEAMNDTIDGLAVGDRKLQSAAASIRENNSRYHALKTIDDALQQRVYKEASGKAPLVRAAEHLATPLATGAVAGAGLAPEGHRFEGGLGGAALGAGIRYGVPAAATALNRGITSAAIRTATSTPGTATKLAGALGRAGIRVAAGEEAGP